jgi:hypothetical protein
MWRVLSSPEHSLPTTPPTTPGLLTFSLCGVKGPPTNMCPPTSSLTPRAASTVRGTRKSKSRSHASRTSESRASASGSDSSLCARSTAVCAGDSSDVTFSRTGGNADALSAIDADPVRICAATRIRSACRSCPPYKMLAAAALDIMAWLLSEMAHSRSGCSAPLIASVWLFRRAVVAERTCLVNESPSTLTSSPVGFSTGSRTKPSMAATDRRRPGRVAAAGFAFAFLALL